MPRAMRHPLGWTALSIALIANCAFDWDGYDPRLGGGASAPVGGAGGAGAGEAGGLAGQGGQTTAGGNGGTGGEGGAGAAAAGGGAPLGGAGGAGGVGGIGGSGEAGAVTTSTTSTTSTSSGIGGEGGGGPLDCGTVDLLNDDFEDGAVDLAVWELFAEGDPAAPTVSETGGARVVALAPSSDQWGSFGTRHRYDMTGKRVSIDVPTMIDTSSGAEAAFAIGCGLHGEAIIRQQGGTVQLELYKEGSGGFIAGFAYSPTQHRYWAFRESGGTLYWETSADGVSFATRAQRSAGQVFPLDMVWIGFGAGAGLSDANPGTARFESLNGGGPASGQLCPTSVLTDDFEDGLRSLEWDDLTELGCTVSETGGVLRFAMTNGSSICEVATPRGFDLTGNSVVIEAHTIPTVDDYYTWLRVERTDGNYIQTDFDGGTLYFTMVAAGSFVAVGSAPWSATDHRWWRIREQQGEIYWETSGNGTAWDTHLQASIPFPASPMRVEIGAENYTGGPIAIAYDNYNLPP